MINSGKHPKHRPTKENIVEVGHDKIGIVNVNIKGNRRHHNSGDTAYNEGSQKPHGKEHGTIQAQFSAPNGG